MGPRGFLRMPERRRAPASLPHPRARPEPRPVEVYLSWQEVHRRTTLSRSTVWRLERLGHFPQHVNLSPGRVSWRERDILAWMAARERPLGATYNEETP